MSPQAEKCVTLAARHAVDPAAVEDNLAKLWREAGQQAQEQNSGNVIRACLWNLLVYNPRPKKKFKDSFGHGYGLRTLLDEVILSIPARILRLEFAESRAVLPTGKGAAAWVAAKCLETDGKRQIYGEEVNLQVHGKSGDSHFPSLVRALLQPSVPIALLGLDDLPQEGWVLEQLLQLCDRVLVDTQSPDFTSDQARIHHFLGTTDAYIVDIGWMRLAPLRYLLAGFFDPPGKPEHLKHIDSIVVEATPQGRNTGMLLLGWLLSRSGGGSFKSIGKGGGKSARKGRDRWRVVKGKKSFPVELRMGPGDGGIDGVLDVDIHAGGERYRIRDVDELYVSLESPHRNEPLVALNGWRDSELVIAALGAQGIDRIYVEALNAAATLIEAQGR